MKTYNGPQRLFVVVFLGLLVCGALGAAPPAQTKKEPPLPFGCFTAVWSESFDVVSTRYDRKTKQLTWVLKAKKDVQLRAYRAELNDPDGVEIAIVGVKFNPNQVELKKGKQIEAIASLADVDVGEVGVLNVREHR